ncbi:MAG: MarR family winged helix-turn-helix transcriptional regulator [Pseudodesulfovibrio sp.]|jgi:DNA-binding MarR family transcriptional regulator|uniref:DNA-binding MarR family transcriptional regulator n=1 Tax=Pseudodesulfovibrio indicus TaxID=1716143 RepID=A0A140D9G2_9BACT|nr:MarR family winged helix-turn-helix transcriptional regulator [Pseudodesulfovibrio indicus]AMK09829.1 hypothetical protein AWY79_01255 [Pseudodesulfovibrio indicus]TDT87493.1 DNA-binding MarR family transcriptional regulator [Pseudodesulfovibrio indicus]
MPAQYQIDRFRHFNRFYTNYLGLLGNSLYGSEVNLSEARVLFELDGRPGSPARDLAARLGLDKGYLSRMLKRFARHGWLEETPSPDDARVKELRLSHAGTLFMAGLHRAAAGQAEEALAHLAPRDRTRLLDAMATIESVLAR